MSRQHEPECQHYVEEAASIRTGACIFCGIARAAYKRGREDATEAADDMMFGDARVTMRRREFLARVRGDGEQA